MRVPRYIQAFMGSDFRSSEGIDVHFDLKDFADPDFRCDLENRKGCYIISSTERKFEYANGLKSKVLYIGESKELYRRIHDEHFNKHLKVLMNDRDFGVRTRRIQQMSDKYQYMLYCGAIVDVFYCKGNQSEKEFESSLIANFYCKYPLYARWQRSSFVLTEITPTDMIQQ